MNINGSINGNPTEPEEDAAVMAGECLYALKRYPKGILQDVLGRLWHGKSRQNCAPVKSVGKPLEEDARSLPVTLTNPIDHLPLFIERREIAVCSARHQVSPCSPNPATD